MIPDWALRTAGVLWLLVVHFLAFVAVLALLEQVAKRGRP